MGTKSAIYAYRIATTGTYFVRVAGSGTGSYVLDVDSQGIRLHVDENRERAGVDDRFDGGEERLCGRDHLVPRSDSARFQGCEHRIRSVRDADPVLDAAVGGKVGLEVFELLPQQKPAGIDRALDGGVQLRPHLGVQGAEIHERNLERRHRDQSTEGTPASHPAWLSKRLSYLSQTTASTIP